MTICRSCGREIIWAVTPEKRRRIPLDPTPCRPGERGAKLLVDGQWAYSADSLAEKIAHREQVSYDRALEFARARYPSHLAHFATCPNADQHRTRR